MSTVNHLKPPGTPSHDTTLSNSLTTTDEPGGNTVVGLLGGGQLGRMLCEAAGPLFLDVAVLDAEKAPAKQAHNSHRDIVGSFKDPAKVRELASVSDCITVEIEHVDTLVLEEIEKSGVDVKLPGGRIKNHRPPVHPSWKTLRLIQDKFMQKEHLRTSNTPIPIAEQVAIEPGDATLRSLKEAGVRLGYPYMLKARKGSYDGRGNFKVNTEEDLSPAMEALGKLPLYAEKWVPFVKELAVMVVRTEDNQGNVKACTPYPTVETVHQDSICVKTFMPPRRVSDKISAEAQRLACDVIATLWGRGVYAVEMFLLDNDCLMVNEVAPRPHNSGHYTIETVPYMSQFQAQLDAVLDLPIPKELTPEKPAAIMVNILGGADPHSHHSLSRLARTTSQDGMRVYLHLYGKESKPGRKIGHITLTGSSTIEELEKQAQPFLKLVDDIREERLKAFAAQLRPQDESTPHLARDVARVPEREPETSAHGHQRNGQQPVVLVTMGSDSDLPVLKAGLDILRQFEVPFSTRITSAHRTPKVMMRLAEEAHKHGYQVIIAAAGGAAHLPGMVSSETPLPVIGVPVRASHLDGLDSLLSIVQMPRGIPTATVGINNATNAALLAIRILSLVTPRYQAQMLAYQRELQEGVMQKDNMISSVGDEKYLSAMKGLTK